VSGVEVIRASGLAAVAHGFLGRRGGVSSGILAGLNVGTGSKDDRDAIAENRRRAVDAILPDAELATVYQVHSADAVIVNSPWPNEDRPRADAMATDRPGLLLGILTADCAPVLLADAEAGVVGAAHAGWRGAAAGVTDSAIAAMESLGASRERIAAAVGPCIAQPSYEVDEAFRSRFLEMDPANERFFIAESGGRPHFDLPGYVRHRLLAAGIGEVETIHLDTYADPGRFFSYRRATHRDEPDYGRQISLIGIAGGNFVDG
jgi:YfiH family protein